MFPFKAKSTANLAPGQFWSIPLSGGRFACGLVLDPKNGGGRHSRTLFLAGLLDWTGDAPPTSAAIAQAPLLQAGYLHVRAVGAVLGQRELGTLQVPAGSSSYFGDSYLEERAERRFVRGDPPPAWELRQVASPLTDEMLRPFASPAGQVQFSSRLSDGDFRTLADWMRSQPSIGLRAYGSYDGTIGDLGFLRFFPFLRSFSADALFDSLPDLDGLKFLPESLESLGIGATRRPLDLGILGRFRSLRSLWIEGQTRGIEAVSTLTALEELTLRSITLPNLSLLLPLQNLLALDLKLGGTKDLSLLPGLKRLRYLELWMVKGLADLEVVADLRALRYLFLQALRRVERLPDLSAAVELRRVHLETMKGLRDLGPLASAPALEEIVLTDMPHLRPEDLQCLVGLPRLRAVAVGLGSLRKNEAAERMLGLPRAPADKMGWRDV